MATTTNTSDLIEVGWRLIPKRSICFAEQYSVGGERGMAIHIIGGHRVDAAGWTLEDFRTIYDGAPF